MCKRKNLLTDNMVGQQHLNQADGIKMLVDFVMASKKNAEQ